MNKRAVWIVIIAFLIILTSLITPWAATGLKSVQDKIWKANYCQEDKDCVNVDFGSPFGCGDYVNANKVASLKKLASVSNILHPTNSLIRIDCEPSPKKAACENNKCVPKTCEPGMPYPSFVAYKDRECNCPEGSILNITNGKMFCMGIEKEPIFLPNN